MAATSLSPAVESRLGKSATGRATLADALFTSTQQKVFGLLFGQLCCPDSPCESV